ncbi:hypothetical protein ACFXJM_38935 [Streptomyces massasporeus]
MPFALHGAQPRKGHTVEIDDWVPLTVQWLGDGCLQHAPLSVVLDVKTSLVEIKTDRDSGEVVELGAVSRIMSGAR